MRILQVHNTYMAGLGGEDIVVDAERKLLLENGHMVEQYLTSNSDINTGSIIKSLSSGIQSIWSSKHYHLLSKKIEDFKPHVVHVHNTFAVMSPSIFWAIKRAKIPCVLTLHNYRLICATSTLFRNGQLCEKCIGRLPLPALQHGCRYNGSVLTGSLLVTTQVVHRCLRTYINCVDAFIVLSNSFSQIMKRANLPADKLYVKYNSVTDSYKQNSALGTRKLLVAYVGQITKAKGVDVLLKAWSSLEMNDGCLVIIGDGPDKAVLQDSYNYRSDIVWMGRQTHEKVFETLRKSRFLVMPSLWHEPFGLSGVEALMLGTPVIVPNHVALALLEGFKEAGFIYNGSSVTSLSQILKQAVRISHLDWDRLSTGARQLYLDNFTPAKNYKSLVEIYDYAIQNVDVQ